MAAHSPARISALTWSRVPGCAQLNCWARGISEVFLPPAPVKQNPPQPVNRPCGDIGWLADRAEWENLRRVGVVEAVREVTGDAPSTERRYYLSSLPPDIAKFARAVRGHWSVENQLHWSLDVSFDEDRSRARTRHAATHLATLRRIALNLLRADKSSAKSLNRKRLRAALVPAYLLSLLKF